MVTAFLCQFFTLEKICIKSRHSHRNTKNEDEKSPILTWVWILTQTVQKWISFSRADRSVVSLSPISSHFFAYALPLTSVLFLSSIFNWCFCYKHCAWKYMLVWMSSLDSIPSSLHHTLLFHFSFFRKWEWGAHSAIDPSFYSFPLSLSSLSFSLPFHSSSPSVVSELFMLIFRLKKGRTVHVLRFAIFWKVLSVSKVAKKMYY